MTLISQAWAYAFKKMKGKARKYTGEPYAVHLAEVVGLVGSIPHTREMIIGSILHDVLEEGTDASYHEIEFLFGKQVAEHVRMLTNISVKEDGDRHARKLLDLQHLSKATPETQSIKLADIISNSVDIATLDPAFAKVYLKEKYQSLPFLMKGDGVLWHLAHDVVYHAMKTVNVRTADVHIFKDAAEISKALVSCRINNCSQQLQGGNQWS